MLTEQPRGTTGEQCKSSGTYSSDGGGKCYFEEGEAFGPCPQSGQKTNWTRVT